MQSKRNRGSPGWASVNWVKAARRVSTNMTKYPVGTRNCEAKRLHLKANVACGRAHVCPSRQNKFGWAPHYGKLPSSLPAKSRRRKHMTTRRELANAIRALSMDAVQRANSGHPGAPMGMADIAEVLWRDFLKHNPAQPAMGGPRPLRALERPRLDAACTRCCT